MIYERMSPSRRCYYHRILAEHLKHMEALGASDYECLIYHSLPRRRTRRWS